jgi:hypothetical protein
VPSGFELEVHTRKDFVWRIDSELIMDKFHAHVWRVDDIRRRPRGQASGKQKRQHENEARKTHGSDQAP